MGEVTTAAVEAAERGWAVFPCRPGDKRPMVGQWEQRATSDPALVARWWPERANVGIACGPSALVVVDLDTHGTLPLGWQEPGIRDGADVLAVLAGAPPGRLAGHLHGAHAQRWPAPLLHRPAG